MTRETFSLVKLFLCALSYLPWENMILLFIEMLRQIIVLLYHRYPDPALGIKTLWRICDKLNSVWLREKKSIYSWSEAHRTLITSILLLLRNF